MDHGGRAGADVVSELDGALVELVRSQGSQDIRLQDDREDERVLGFRLAAAEVIRQHVGMLLLQESKLRSRLGPQVARSGRKRLGAGTRAILSSVDHREGSAGAFSEASDADVTTGRGTQQDARDEAVGELLHSEPRGNAAVGHNKCVVGRREGQPRRAETGETRGETEGIRRER